MIFDVIAFTAALTLIASGAQIVLWKPRSNTND